MANNTAEVPAQGTSEVPALSVAEVQKIAHLSKLSLEGSELEKLAHDFNGILDFVAQIKEADTAGAPAIDHPLGHINAQRDDKPQPSISQDDIRAFAPKFEAGFFVVPRVIETDA